MRALENRSRAPHSHPHAVPAEVLQLLVAARKKHPRWGPRKLLVVVQRQHPRVELPAASTVGAFLKKQGLIGRVRRVRRSDPYKDRLGPYDAPNRVWCADFKGNFAVLKTISAQAPGTAAAGEPRSDRGRDAVGVTGAAS